MIGPSTHAATRALVKEISGKVLDRLAASERAVSPKEFVALRPSRKTVT